MYLEFEEHYAETKAVELFEKGLTKTEISLRAKQVVDTVLEKGNALKTAEALSAMEAFVKEIKDDPRFKDYVRTEAGKEFKTSSGATIAACEVGTKYNFEKCGDLVYEKLLLDFITADVAKKEREAFLKAVPNSGIQQVNQETGELYTIYPPSKTSTSSYKVSLSSK